MSNPRKSSSKLKFHKGDKVIVVPYGKELPIFTGRVTKPKGNFVYILGRYNTRDYKNITTHSSQEINVGVENVRHVL